MIYALLMFSIHLLIILNTLECKSFVLFGMYTLLDKSLRVVQLPAHLSNLTENG